MTTLPADRSAARYSRRRLLTAGAAGAAAVGARGLFCAHAAHAQEGRADRFGRMFELPAFAQPTDRVRAALLEIGRPGGLLDAKDALERGPVVLITDLELSKNNRNNPEHPAGATFMGQFMDHDMTFDIGSRLGVATRPESATNGRTPALDLDSVYGGGPTVSPQLYDTNDRITFKVERGGQFEDLPRTRDNEAIIGDPRNDEHLVLSGLHAAFLLFHNRVVERLRRRSGADRSEVFAEARRVTTWHYQWLIVHEFLPLFIGRSLVEDILRSGRRFYQPGGEPSIPVEFQGAAYRFGHSMVRPSYRANLAGDRGGAFFGIIFDPAESGKRDPDDLSGGVRASRRFIGWQTFFDFGDGEVKPNKRIDTRLSTPLFNLPPGTIAGSQQTPTALAQRTLLRHLTWELPSGQRIARAMRAPSLSERDLDELADFELGFERDTPLFYYVLKEAELVEDGLRLGPVGGRIVGEVILGLLQLDPESYLSAQPRWRPTLADRDGDFRMVDFLTFAGVDPASRGQ